MLDKEVVHINDASKAKNLKHQITKSDVGIVVGQMSLAIRGELNVKWG